MGNLSPKTSSRIHVQNLEYSCANNSSSVKAESCNGTTEDLPSKCTTVRTNGETTTMDQTPSDSTIGARLNTTSGDVLRCGGLHCISETCSSNGQAFDVVPAFNSSSRISSGRISVASIKGDRIIEAAFFKCKSLLMQLENGTMPDQNQLKNSLSTILEVLSSISDKESLPECAQVDSMVNDDEIRAWLTSTFSHSGQCNKTDGQNRKLSFRAVVDTILVGQYFKKIHETPIVVSNDVKEFFQVHLDTWNCDVFHLNALTNGQPLKHLGYELFRYYDILGAFKISHTALNDFLDCIEDGYKKHNNSYHNSIHATDVTQTLHYFIQSACLQGWLSDLEIFAMLFSALIHDLEHTGTSNGFHIHSQSELALCYNDTSVLENFHIYKAFSILNQDGCNILRNLSDEDFFTFRSLVIEMVLSTDMSKHFQHLKHVKKVVSSSDAWKQIQNAEKPRVLSWLLHIADISHPGKSWQFHEKWTYMLIEEFFRQGDKEKELNLPCSPLCDRTTTLVPESQIGFIDVIVSPGYEVCGNIMETILKHMPSKARLAKGSRSCDQHVTNEVCVWSEAIEENRIKWKDLCKQ